MPGSMICVVNIGHPITRTLDALERQDTRPDQICVLNTPLGGALREDDDIEIHEVTNGWQLVSTLDSLLESSPFEWFGVLKSGVEPAPDWLASLGKALEGGAVAARARMIWEGAVYLGARYLATLEEGLVGDRLGTADAVHGYQALYKTDALRAAGGFANADTLLPDPGPRLAAAGGALVRVDSSSAGHRAPKTLKAALDLRWRRGFVSRQHALEDHPPADALHASIAHHLETTRRTIDELLTLRRYHLLYPALLAALRAIMRDAYALPALADTGVTLPKGLLTTFLKAIDPGDTATEQLRIHLREDVRDLLPHTDMSPANAAKGTEPATSTPADGDTPHEPASSLLEQAEPFLHQGVHRLTSSLARATRVGLTMVLSSAKRDRFEQSHAHVISPDGFKVLLLNPPWKTTSGRLGVRAGSRWPFTMEACNDKVDIPHYVPFPFFLAYTAAHLKKHGIPNLLIDAIAEGFNDEEFIALARGYDPQLIIMETSTASIDIDLGYVRLLKTLLPESMICLSGSHASIQARTLLGKHPEIDYVIDGEIEDAALELATALKEGRTNPQGIPGIAYRRGDEVIPQGKARAPSFDALPWPERMMVPMYNYDDRPVPAMEWPCLQLTATRGCPYKCSFCLWPQVIFNGTSVKYRVRDPEDVAKEIRWAVSTFGFKSFYLDDDTFNIGKRRMLKLAQALKDHGLDSLHWMGMARSDHADRETLAALRQSGMVAIKFGVESGVQSMVDRIEKDLDLAGVEEAVKICKTEGIQVHLTYSIGLPGETLMTIRQTFEHALRMEPDSIQLSMMTPFPGTKLYEEVQSKGQLQAHAWSDFDGNASTVTITEHLSKRELEEKHKLFLELWGRFIEGKPLPEVGMLSMFSGASIDEVKRALHGEDVDLPLARDTLVKALRGQWPETLVHSLSSTLQAREIAVVGLEGLKTAIHFNRKATVHASLVIPDDEHRAYAQFVKLCNRLPMKVSADLEAQERPQAVLMAGALPTTFLSMLKTRLDIRALLIDIIAPDDPQPGAAVEAVKSAGFRVADIIEDSGYLVVLAIQPAPVQGRWDKRSET